MAQYYPKSQIKTNLYTEGRKYALSTTREEYIGFYYELYTGQKYTGKYPGDGKNIQLITSDSYPNKEGNDNIIPENIITVLPFPGESDPSTIHSHNNYVYSTIVTQQKSENRKSPLSVSPSPTLTDYKKGSMNRYFVKKNNQNIYFETTIDDHVLLQKKSSQICWDLYSSVSLQWFIQGRANIVESKNIVSVRNASKNSKWPAFSSYFTNYLQYHLAKINFA